MPSAQPAKLNCSGIPLAEGQAAIQDIAYWKVKEEEGSSVANDFHFFMGAGGGGVCRYPTLDVFEVDLWQYEDLKLSLNLYISQ